MNRQFNDRHDASRSRLGHEITIKWIESLLRGLVNIESESGRERQVIEFAEGLLRIAGISTTRQGVGPNRFNLIAHLGQRYCGLLLNTHADTVPRFASQKRRAFVSRGWLYGRGACDAKGSLAAMLAAFITARRLCGNRGLSATLSVMVGEENSGDGVARLMEQRVKYEYAIVGEPTALGIANRQAGYVEVDIHVQRKRCHAFDPIDRQAVLDMAQVLLRIERVVIAKYGPGVVPFVRWIKGGDANEFWYMRDECSARLIINVPPEVESGAVMKLLNSVIQVKRTSPHQRSDARMVLTDEDDGVMTVRSTAIVRKLRAALREVGVRPRLVYMPSWTDGSTLAASGIPTVIFGPGRLADAHTDVERVRLADVRTAAMALTRLLLTWRA